MRARMTDLIRRRGPRLSPSVLGELEQLDAALDGAGGDPLLDSLVADVRACAPRMSAASAARLDARAADGFQSQRPDAARRWSRRRAAVASGALVTRDGRRDASGRPSARSGRDGRSIGFGPRGRLALGSGAVAAVVAASVVVTMTAGQRHPAARSVSAAQSAAAPASANGTGAPSGGAGRASAPGLSAPGPGRAPASAASGARRQQVSASLSLSTSGLVQGISDGVVRVTGAYGGYVQSSQVQDGKDGGQGYLVVVLPTAHLGVALGELSRLAHVQSTNQDTNDITDAYNSARRQLADDVTQRRALLRALARATTQGQIDSLRSQLELAGGRVDHDRVALDSVDRQSRTSQVNVTIASSPTRAGGWTIGNALNDAGMILETMAGVALVAGAISVPVLLILATLLAAARALRRARRERALDAPV